MTTTVVFDILTDDEHLRAAVSEISDDQVLVWKIAVFVAQMQLEKAIAHRAVADHYATIHMRARATREARRLAML